MNIVIPMAGLGTRFPNHPMPKPLIPINDSTLITECVKSLALDGNYIFITRKYDDPKYNQELNDLLNSIVDRPVIIEIDYVTEGPACTALLASRYINNDEELIIVNCDQIFKWDSKKFRNFLDRSNYAGVVVTYPCQESSKSYALIDESGFVKEIKEKQVISTHALTGLHYWFQGKLFVESAEADIRGKRKYKNEYYVGPTYNHLIRNDWNVGIYEIPSEEFVAVGDENDLRKIITE